MANLSKLPRVAICHHCQQTKPLAQLNGYDPITGNTNHAYCRNLTECNSTFAHQQLQMLNAIFSTPAQHA